MSASDRRSGPGEHGRDRGPHPSDLYREIPPPEPLAPYVDCFWTLHAPRPLRRARRHRVLPDGCSDVIFDLRDPRAGGRAPRHGLRSYVVGAMRTAIVVEHVGTLDLLGVRFRSGGAVPVTGVPAAELTGRVAALGEVIPDWKHLGARLAEARPRSRPGLLGETILERLRRPGAEKDSRVERAVSLIERHDGRIAVGRIAAEVSLSRRHLERLFVREVGTTPKETCRVSRFRSAVRRLHAVRNPSLSEVAHASGYADQSHLTREFQRIGGTTPARYGRTPDVAFVQDEDVTDG